MFSCTAWGGDGPPFLETAPNTIAGVIQQIDRLTLRDLELDAENRLAQKGPSLRALVGELNRLVQATHQHFAQVEACLTRASQTPTQVR